MIKTYFDDRTGTNEMRLNSLYIGFLFFSVPLTSKGEETTTYSITYLAQSGLATASANRSLAKITDDLYELTNTLDIGIAGQVLAEMEEKSQMSLANGFLRPNQYNLEQAGFSKETVEVVYDWDQFVARVTTSNGISHFDLRENTFDQLSHQLAIRRDFNRGIREFTYSVVGESGLKEYRYNIIGEETIQTPLGSFESVKIERTEPTRASHSTIFWLSTKWAGVLLQIEQILNEGLTVTLEIQKGVVNEQPIIGKTD